jgi:hypothetical protein
VLTGIDIATYQQTLNIEALPAAGVHLVIHKASGANGGRLYVDSGYRRIAPRVRAAGLALGHYFFNGPVHPAESARFFVANLTAYQPGDPLALDVEGEGLQNVAWSTTWFETVLQLIPDANLFLYTTQGYVREWDWSPVVALGVRLWIAAPGDDSPFAGEFGDSAIHQHTWTATYAGYRPLDGNHVREDVIRTTTPSEGDDMYDDDAKKALFDELEQLRPIKLYQWGTGLIWVGPGGKEWVVPNDDYVILGDHLKQAPRRPIPITDGMHTFLTKQFLPGLHPDPANQVIEAILKLSEAEAKSLADNIRAGIAA